MASGIVARFCSVHMGMRQNVRSTGYEIGVSKDDLLIIYLGLSNFGLDKISVP